MVTGTWRINRSQAITASAFGTPIRFRIEQPMQVDDEISHQGVIDGLLRLGFPGGIGARVVGIDADDVELVQVPELDLVQIGELAAEHEMKQLLACSLLRHGCIPRSIVRFRISDHANSAIRSRMRSSNAS